MKRIPYQVGGRALLFLALAPGLAAGTKFSLAKAFPVVVGGAGALARLAGADGQGAASSAVILDDESPASILADGCDGDACPLPAAAATFKNKEYFWNMRMHCGGPQLEPREDLDRELITLLVTTASKDYLAAGCEKDLVQTPECFEPEFETWKQPRPAGSVKEMTQDRLKGHLRHARDLDGTAARAEAWSIALDRIVFFALEEYLEKSGPAQFRALLTRLTEARFLQGELDKVYRRAQVLEAMALAKERIAIKSGRKRKIDDAQYELARVRNAMGKASNALGRFPHALLEELGPGLAIHMPVPPAAGAVPAKPGK